MTEFESNLATVITELQELVKAYVPTGAVQAFAMSSAPTGWLICDGSAVSRTDYAALYAAIGTTFGIGDGSTTFNLPSLKDKFSLGLGSTYSTLGATGGEATHTLTTSEMPSHAHSYTRPSSTSHQDGTQNMDIYINLISDTTGYTGGGAAHNNMPSYIVLNYCIKY
jgi:microcystin-dependent protein